MLRLYTTLFFCTIKKNEHVIFRAFLMNARKINSSFTYVPRTCRGEPYVRPSYIGTKALLVRGRTQGSPLHSSFPKYPTYEQNQCRGEPYVRPPNNNRLRAYAAQGLWIKCCSASILPYVIQNIARNKFRSWVYC